ncbi:MAG: non-canonical purine NTP pyrophosphatase [Acidimicrobiia bacterium]|nr:non-canonical purine NTP pyrophosphatase [Acidimicrobiia bacterium]
MYKFVLATHNDNKRAEIEEIFRKNFTGDFIFVPGVDPGEVIEDGETIEENARIKAHAWLSVNPDCIAIADDTGLFVDAIEGRPGIWAARYAGENATYDDNCNKLLEELSSVSKENRTARFSTCAIAAGKNINDVVAIGNIEGIISSEKTGDSGFGYDPIFIPTDYGNDKTYSQLGNEYKNSYSHRSKAFRSLVMGILNSKL